MSYDRVEAIPLIADAAEHDRDDDTDEAYSPKSELHDSRREKAGERKLSLSTILVVSAFAASLVSLLCSTLTLTSTLRGRTGTGSTSSVPEVATVSGRPKSEKLHELMQGLRRPSLYLGMERVPGYGASRHASSSQVLGVQANMAMKHPGAPQEMARVNSRFPTLSFAQDGWVLLTEDVRFSPLNPLLLLMLRSRWLETLSD